MPTHQSSATPTTTPSVLVLFGVTGDLVQRKTLGALYQLYLDGLLPKNFQVLGIARSDLHDDSLRKQLKSVMRKQSLPEKKQWKSFLSRFNYLQGDFNEDDLYTRLGERLGQTDGRWNTCSNKLFYLSVPPQMYPPIVEHLAKSGLTKPCSDSEGWTRVILEKPFGTDYSSASSLDTLLAKSFKEEQIYRVDHYLAKETVRNILAFRFSNAFLQPAWNKQWVEKIEVDLYESIGVENRGSFYDSVGALRDVGENHALQLLSLFVMEAPQSYSAEHIRAARVQALKRLGIPERKYANYTQRFQYRGYKKIEGVAAGSTTETAFEIQLRMKAGVFAGVPIMLRAGKSMDQSGVQVKMTLRHPDKCLCPASHDGSNTLIYSIQPKERVGMNIIVKKPGHDFELVPTDFHFDYDESFGTRDAIAPYEQVLLDIITGDQTQFVSTEEVLAQWKLVEPIVKAWQKGKPALKTYASDTNPFVDKKKSKKK